MQGMMQRRLPLDWEAWLSLAGCSFLFPTHDDNRMGSGKSRRNVSSPPWVYAFNPPRQVPDGPTLEVQLSRPVRQPTGCLWLSNS